MSACNAFSSIRSPSWKSMARLVLPSRLELKRPEGSSNEAPLATVSFTTALYVSPVQMMPACCHTGTPLHFHSSTTSGSACLMTIRSRASISPRQSLSSLILASISREGECPAFPSFGPLVLFFMVVSLSSFSIWLRQTSLDVVVGDYDQVAQSRNVQFFAGAQLHMTHALARAFEQAGGIREHGAIEEADIRMSLECVDIAKRRVLHTNDRTSVVQELAHIGAAAAHALKPCPRHQAKRIGEVGKPSLYLRIASD